MIDQTDKCRADDYKYDSGGEQGVRMSAFDVRRITETENMELLSGGRQEAGFGRACVKSVHLWFRAAPKEKEPLKKGSFFVQR